MDYSRRGECIGDTAQQLACDYYKEDKSGRYDVVCANNKQGRCMRNLSINGHCTASIPDQPVCCDYRPMFCGGGMCRHYKMGMCVMREYLWAAIITSAFAIAAFWWMVK